MHPQTTNMCWNVTECDNPYNSKNDPITYDLPSDHPLQYSWYCLTKVLLFQKNRMSLLIVKD